MPPTINRINPPELGTPPGYSQVVEISAGKIIFISGQTALDRDGNVVGKNDFAAQAGVQKLLSLVRLRSHRLNPKIRKPHLLSNTSHHRGQGELHLPIRVCRLNPYMARPFLPCD